jgi:hypothetical protein
MKRSLLSTFPDHLPVGGDGTSHYLRQSGLFAVHGPLPERLGRSVILVLPEEQISVCRGEPEPEMISQIRITPVYALESGGTPAVPTGRVFVRFAERVRAESRRAELDQAGYVIVEIPAYAPHAAWVRAANGDIGTSLIQLSALNQVPDVRHVEPQMLMPHEKR